MWFPDCTETFYTKAGRKTNFQKHGVYPESFQCSVVIVSLPVAADAVTSSLEIACLTRPWISFFSSSWISVLAVWQPESAIRVGVCR